MGGGETRHIRRSVMTEFCPNSRNFKDLYKYSMTFQASNPNFQIPWLSSFSMTCANPILQGGYHNLLKELQFDGEKLKYCWTENLKSRQICSENTWPWRHILDSPIRFFYKVAVQITTWNNSVYRIHKTNRTVAYRHTGRPCWEVRQQYYNFVIFLWF